VAIVEPGNDRKGVQVGAQEHVAFADAHKALDRGAIKPYAVIHDVYELARGHSDGLDGPHDVCELQADKADPVVPNRLEDRLLTVRGHVPSW